MIDQYQRFWNFNGKFSVFANLSVLDDAIKLWNLWGEYWVEELSQFEDKLQVITSLYCSSWALVDPLSLDVSPPGQHAVFYQRNYVEKSTWKWKWRDIGSTPRGIHVDLTPISRQYVKDQISTNFNVISMYFFDVISLIEKSTSFPRTFFDVISLVENCMLFPHTFWGVIRWSKIHVVFSYFFRCNIFGRNIHVAFTYFFRRNFDG